ncbi:hypothetical protein Leryth_005441 [Lithospermum erythrorhizon]|nr:hypothetical protein Leryth_005441 [Lithospermum erythrorhizon]
MLSSSVCDAMCDQQESEQKKIAEEEAKAKEMELKSAEEAATANPELIEVKERLEKLEETVKDIVVETKKRSSNLEDKSKLENSKQEPTPTKPNNSPDNKHSSSASTTKTSSKAESDVSTRDVDSRSNGSSHKKI